MCLFPHVADTKQVSPVNFSAAIRPSSLPLHPPAFYFIFLVGRGSLFLLSGSSFLLLFLLVRVYMSECEQQVQTESESKKPHKKDRGEGGAAMKHQLGQVRERETEGRGERQREKEREFGGGFSSHNSTRLRRFFTRFPEPRQLEIWVCVFRLPAGETEQHQQRLARTAATGARLFFWSSLGFGSSGMAWKKIEKRRRSRRREWRMKKEHDGESPRERKEEEEEGMLLSSADQRLKSPESGGDGEVRATLMSVQVRACARRRSRKPSAGLKPILHRLFNCRPLLGKVGGG